MECPKCKKEIVTLSYNSKVEATQIFEVSNDGYGTYSSMDLCDDHLDEEYKCPECYETLFTEEEDAIEFLKGD